MMTLLMISFLSLLFIDCLSSFIALSFSLMWVTLMLKHDLDWFFIFKGLMLDSTSMVLSVLSIWVSMLMILVAMKSDNKSYFLKMMIVGLMISCIGVFVSGDYLWFYILFEICLIPTLILIIGWGYQPERMQAGVYMMLYTLVSSLPLLIVFMVVKSWEGSLSMLLLKPIFIESLGGLMFTVFSFSAFLVKLPMFMVHLWLPKAHVEAPVVGSMILAGVLLKLGGYGLLRMMSLIGYMMPKLFMFVMVWALVGGMMVSLLCLREVDIKSLIALSSVVHMAMVLGGVLSQSSWGIKGALIIMIGHGLCSSGLFYIAYMSYLRYNSRSFNIMKGMYSLIPVLSLMWFLLVSNNMSSPPSLNLLGEMMVIISLVNWSKSLMLIVGLLVFFSAAYSLMMYMKVQHGKSGMGVGMLNMASVNELSVLMLHWMPLNLMFLMSLW